LPLDPLDEPVQLAVDAPTLTQTVVVPATVPETPVTVTEYAPLVVVLVVPAVSVAVSAVVPLMVTEVGDRLQVTGLVGLVRVVLTAQLKATEPVNELPGVTVMVAVLLLVAPAVTAMLPLLEREKLVVDVLLGACQKSPQPARKTTRSGDAAIKYLARLPILIAAPLYRIGAHRVPVSRVLPGRASCLIGRLDATAIARTRMVSMIPARSAPGGRRNSV
jgi:hypothetical protein